jgi:hypothetical protein
LQKAVQLVASGQKTNAYYTVTVAHELRISVHWISFPVIASFVRYLTAR